MPDIFVSEINSKTGESFLIEIRKRRNALESPNPREFQHNILIMFGGVAQQPPPLDQ